MSTIYTAPSKPFETTLETAPTGLVGTIGVRIVDGVGATTLARTTTGIVESPAGSGIYTATLTAPAATGQYSVVWDTGSVTPTTVGVDELVVTAKGVLAAITGSDEGIVAERGATFETTLTGGASGLTGTVGVRITDGTGATILARTTTGIVESPAGSGVYTATLTAPSSVGQYEVVWDTGGATPTYAVDALTVIGADLITLADVRQYLQTPDTDTQQDGVIVSLIAKASRTITRRVGIDFAPATAVARTFTYYGGSFLSLTPYVLRSASSVILDSDLAAPVTLIAGTDYFLRQPTIDGVYQSVTLPLATSTSLQGRAVTITGDWGYTSVPEDVKLACLVTVATWLRRDVSAFTTTYGADEATANRPISLPYAAQDLIAPYRTPVIA